jgi:DNA transposition AAA+ family ATPase
MRKHFVRTENFTALEIGVQGLQECGAREARYMLATGRPGEGKTTNLHHLGANLQAVFVTAQQGWTPSQMLKALSLVMKVQLGSDPNSAIGEALTPAPNEEARIIIIDEAQFTLQGGAACLDRLRGITDKNGTPVILVAMADDVHKFAKREQISSRIFNWVKFQPTTPDDVARACQELAEVQIAPDLIARIHADTAGRMRDVIKAISRIEMVAKASGKDIVRAADLRKTTLCEDYRSGIPVLAAKAVTKGSDAAVQAAVRGVA